MLHIEWQEGIVRTRYRATLRNVFDQYSQNENRLTHALASVLHSDEGLRGNFLKRFLSDQVQPEANRVFVNEQSYPMQPSLSEQDAEQA
jgi:hypothetical protein